MDSDIDKTSFGCGIMTRDFLQGFMTNKICSYEIENVSVTHFFI